MGLFDEDYNVQVIEGYLRSDEQHLRAQKEARDAVKRNGTYKNHPKCYAWPGGRVGNVYDNNVWAAEEGVKRRKAQLAQAKKDAAEAKKKKAAKEREEKKEKAAREREEAAERRAAEKSAKSSSRSSSSSCSSSSSSSSSSYSSSSYSSSSSYDDDYSSKKSSGESFASTIKKGIDRTKALLEAEETVEEYKKDLKDKYQLDGANELQLIAWHQELSKESRRLNKLYNECESDIASYAFEECKSDVDELRDSIEKKVKEIFIGKYTKHIKNAFPIETASDSDLVKMLPGLLAEIKEQEQERNNNKDFDIIRSIYSQQKQIAQTAATNACLRLKKLNNSLYKSSEVQKLVSQIDPNLQDGILLVATQIRTKLDELKAMPKTMAEKLKAGIEERINKVVSPIKEKCDKITEKINSIIDIFNK